MAFLPHGFTLTQFKKWRRKILKCNTISFEFSFDSYVLCQICARNFVREEAKIYERTLQMHLATTIFIYLLLFLTANCLIYSITIQHNVRIRLEATG